MNQSFTTKGVCGCFLIGFSTLIFADVLSSVSSFPLVQPIDEDPIVDLALARVGWHLFRDPKLSSDGTVSCQTCHNLKTNGAQDIAVSVGVHGVGTRNSPTVFNAALNYRFLWDGSVNSLMAQIDGPVTNPLEMDSSWGDIEKYVQSQASYQALFKRADDRTINVENIKSAIVEFVKGLQTPGAPFDAYLLGDPDALTEQAKRGWETFQQVGCVQCHQGKNIGGAMIQRFTYFKNDEDESLDTGRHLRTMDGEDKYYFRVASLRNVTKTSPYFHNGQITKLSEAIDIMSRTQLGVTMSDDKVADIEAFLHSLTSPRPTMLEVLESE